MATQSAQFDLSSSSLDQPKTIAYGLVRGAGNLILQHELGDKSRVAFYMLGEGPWDSILRLWINNKQVTLPSAGAVHFHPGVDGEMGNGVAAVSTGGDQHVDQFFTLIPGGLDPITFSRYAWLALKVAPDPSAPSATLTVLADYQALQVRQFDSIGNQTAFAWTQNWAWNICDFLIRKFVLREAKANQPLVTAELARFDWASFAAAATYYDSILSGGQTRFSDGGVVFVNDSDTADRALEQMLTISRSYILERNGKLSLYADQPRASVFTFTSDNVAPLSSKVSPSASVAASSGGKLTFTGRKSNLRAAANRLTATYRDSNIASGSSDDATRFAISTLKLDHEAHQRAVGARGPGLSVLPKVTELALDLGVNTPERVWRILSAMLVRQLGDDVDANTAYNAPFTADWTGFEDSLAVEPGDVVTLDKSLSEEFGGKLVEVLRIEEAPDGTRNFTALEYMPNAFPDVAPSQQLLQAPIPGTGLSNAAIQDSNGPTGKNICPNPGFELNSGGTPLNTPLILLAAVSDGWFISVLDSTYWLPQLQSTQPPRSGSRSLFTSLPAGITIAASSPVFAMRVVSRKISVRNGDVLRVQAWMRWAINAAIPAGLTILQRIGLILYDINDAFLAELVADVQNGSGGFATYILKQASLQINNAAVSYVRVQCGAFVQNTSGAPIATGANLYADLSWDDISVVFNSTAADLTPLNTSAHATAPGGALSQSGTSGTVLVASRTIQYGFGPVTYSAGSVSPGLGTWFIYADDPTYAGGAVTYQASATESDVYASDFRVYFGKITLSAGGGGTSTSAPGSGGGRLALN